MPNPFVGSFPGLPEAEEELARTPPPNAPGVGFAGIPEMPVGGTVGGALDPIGLRAIVDSLGAGAGRIGSAISDTVLPAFPPQTQTAMTDLAKTVAPLAPELTPAGDLTAAFKGAGDITGGARALDPQRMLRGAGELGLGMTAAAIPGASVGLLRRGVDQATGLARRVAPVAAAPVTSAKQALMDGVRRGVATRGGGRVEDVGVSTLLRDDAGNRIRVFHGSPHDFDRFDSTRIGTGEGAQAYGHGLYFAESEGVARSYRDALSERSDVIIGGKPISAENSFSSSSAPDSIVAARLASLHRDIRDPDKKSSQIVQRAMSDIESSLARAPDFETFQSLTDQKLALQRFMEQGIEFKPKGSMFEVDILGRPEEFLDYDAPIAQQSKIVKKLLLSMPQFSKRLNVDDELISGDHIIAELQNTLGPAEASEALRKAGIKGIRYRDAGSRAPLATYKGSGSRVDRLGGSLSSEDQAVNGILRLMEDGELSADKAIKAWRKDAAETIKAFGDNGAAQIWEGRLAAVNRLDPKDFQMPEHTRNFVVFDDSMLEIIRKYGLVLPGAAGAAGAAQSITDPGALGADQAGGA